jgi:hypothetical protein
MKQVQFTVFGLLPEVASCIDVPDTPNGPIR